MDAGSGVGTVSGGEIPYKTAGADSSDGFAKSVDIHMDEVLAVYPNRTRAGSPKACKGSAVPVVVVPVQA